MTSSNTQVVFLFDAHIAKCTRSALQEKLSLITMVLVNELPTQPLLQKWRLNSIPFHNLIASKDTYQWGYKIVSKTDKFEKQMVCSPKPFSADTINQLKVDLDKKSESVDVKLDVEAISSNLTVMMHDFEWDRVQVLSPVKRSQQIRTRNTADVDEKMLPTICTSYQDVKIIPKQTNVVCIVGPIPSNITSEMKELQSKRSEKQKTSRSFLLNHISTHLKHKLNARIYWLNTNCEKIKKSDLEIVKKTLKDFNGSLLPLSLLRHHPFTKCLKCMKTSNHLSIFPNSYLIKNLELSSHHEQHPKTSNLCKIIFKNQILMDCGSIYSLLKTPPSVHQNLLPLAFYTSQRSQITPNSEMESIAMNQMPIASYQLSHPPCGGACVSSTSHSISLNLIGHIPSPNPILDSKLLTGVHHVCSFTSDQLDHLGPLNGQMLVVRISCKLETRSDAVFDHFGVLQRTSRTSLGISWIRSSTSSLLQNVIFSASTPSDQQKTSSHLDELLTTFSNKMSIQIESDKIKEQNTSNERLLSWQSYLLEPWVSSLEPKSTSLHKFRTTLARSRKRGDGNSAMWGRLQRRYRDCEQKERVITSDHQISENLEKSNLPILQKSEDSAKSFHDVITACIESCVTSLQDDSSQQFHQVASSVVSQLFHYSSECEKSNRVYDAIVDHVIPAIEQNASTWSHRLKAFVIMELAKTRNELDEDYDVTNEQRMLFETLRALPVNGGVSALIDFFHESLIPNYSASCGRLLADVLNEYMIPLPDCLKHFDDDTSSVATSSVASLPTSYEMRSADSGWSLSTRRRRGANARALPLNLAPRRVNLRSSHHFAGSLERKSHDLLKVDSTPPKARNSAPTTRSSARRNLFSTESRVSVGSSRREPVYEERRSRQRSIQDTPDHKKSLGSAMRRQRIRTRSKYCSKDEKIDDFIAESPNALKESSPRLRQQLSKTLSFYGESTTQARSTRRGQMSLRNQLPPLFSPRTRLFGVRKQHESPTKRNKSAIRALHFTTPPRNQDSVFMTSCEEQAMTSLDEPVVTSCDKPVVTSCDEPVVTSCDEPVVTSCDKPVVTSCDKPVVTSFDEPVVTSLDEPVVTSCDKPAVTSCDQTIVTSFDEQMLTSNDTSVMTSHDNSAMTSCDEHTNQIVENQNIFEDILTKFACNKSPPSSGHKIDFESWDFVTNDDVIGKTPKQIKLWPRRKRRVSASSEATRCSKRYRRASSSSSGVDVEDMLDVSMSLRSSR